MQQFIEYLRQFGHFQRNSRLYLLQSALGGIAIGFFTLLYPLYLSALGYKIDLIGLVLFFIPLGTGLGIIPAGPCVDRFSGKAILIWSSVVIVIVLLGQILFRDLVLLCISTFLLGAGISFQYILNAPFLTTHSTPDERPHLFSFNVVLILATGVLGQLLGGALPVWLRAHPQTMFPQFGWLLASEPLTRSYQIALLCGVLIALTSFIPLLLMTAHRPTHTRSERQSFWRVFRKNLKKDTPTRQDATDAEIKLPFWQRLRLFLLSPLAIMTGACALSGFGTGLIYPYFGLFFVEHLGANSALYGILSGSSNALLAFATLLAPWMVMRIGRLKTIVFTSLLSLPVMLCMGIFPILLLAALLYPLFQALWNMSNGILDLFSMEIVRPQLQGKANSTYQIAVQGTLAMATPIGGLLISRIGYTPVFWITAVLFFLPEVLLWWRFANKRFVPPEATEDNQGERDLASSTAQNLVPLQHHEK